MKVKSRPYYSSVENCQSCSSSKSIFCILMIVICLLCVIISVSLTVSFGLQAKECLAAKTLVERMNNDEGGLACDDQIRTLSQEIREMEETITNLRKSILNNRKSSEGIVLVGGKEKSGNLLLHGRPVCDDGWELPAADVACKMLGFPGAEEKTTNSHFGLVSDNFLMDDVVCAGEEDNLFHCSFDSKSIQCDQYEGAGVVCT